MAEDVTAQPAPVERREERARRSGYRLRFGVVYVLLAALVGAGVGAFVVLVLRPAPAEEPPWSTWRPTGSETAMLRQIADRIPKQYTQDGEQLVVSTASRLVVSAEGTEVPIDAIIVQPDTSRGLAEEEDVAVHEGEDVASYALCAVGNERCAITKGMPSTERLTLLKRQALELSLFTLKYVEGINSVLVFLPPNPSGDSTGAVFLRRADVADELRHPLAELLPAREVTVGALGELEEGQVLRLTGARTYSHAIQLSPNGNPVLVLTPPTQQP